MWYYWRWKWFSKALSMWTCLIETFPYIWWKKEDYLPAVPDVYLSSTNLLNHFLIFNNCGSPHSKTRSPAARIVSAALGLRSFNWKENYVQYALAKSSKFSLVLTENFILSLGYYLAPVCFCPSWTKLFLQVIITRRLSNLQSALVADKASSDRINLKVTYMISFVVSSYFKLWVL